MSIVTKQKNKNLAQTDADKCFLILILYIIFLICQYQLVIFPQERSEKMSLGTNISTLRTMRGLTQKELAKKIGVSPNFISHLETGVKRPSVKRLVELADVLDCSLDYLVNRKNL